MTKETYSVSGMTCASCASSIESFLSAQEGIDAVSVNYPNQSVSISYNPEILDLGNIEEKVKSLGYELITGESEAQREQLDDREAKRLDALKKKLVFAILFSVPVFIISMFFMGKFNYQNWILLALSLPVITYSGAEFYRNSWKQLKHLSSNMDTLVALSTGVAFVFSAFNTIYPDFFIQRGLHPHVYFESAVIIITLILLGRYLEEQAKRKTSSAIKKLMGLRPSEVTAIRNGEEQTIPLEEIIPGDIILLKPGNKVPIDGKVKRGESFIDESMITGEPVPVFKEKGAQVIAGTINQKGTLTILAQKIGGETMLSQIIKLVEEAQSSKPNIQKLADRVAGIFVPIVLLIAIATFVVWLIFGPEPQETYALLSLITVLIIACPCALGLATPTALMVGIGKGAEQGILIKDANVLETAYKLNALILDKTGTLTEGKPSVQKIEWLQDSYKKQYAPILKSIESSSEHPLGEAIVQYLSDQETFSLTSFDSKTGKGAIAEIDGVQYFVGNESLATEFTELNLETESIINRLKQSGSTLVLFGMNSSIIAIIGIQDKIKDGVQRTLQRIKSLGIEVHMLTGDHENAASNVATKAGIKNFKANVMPEEKGNYIKQLQGKGLVVAMAGDGINDSHALAQADVGIAMGSGTDIAMESAGITLIHSDLNQIEKAISLSKATMKTIKQNLFWAFIYNIIAIPIAAGALYPSFHFLLSPMIAGGAMSMSSISVLLNSLRLKKRNI